MTNKKNLFNISESEVSEDEPEENKPVRDPISNVLGYVQMTYTMRILTNM